MLLTWREWWRLEHGQKPVSIGEEGGKIDWLLSRGHLDVARIVMRFSIGWTAMILVTMTWGQFHQHVYEQLLHRQIPNAQKAAGHDCLFALLGSAHVKAACKMFVKLTLDLHLPSGKELTNPVANFKEDRPKKSCKFRNKTRNGIVPVS